MWVIVMVILGVAAFFAITAAIIATAPYAAITIIIVCVLAVLGYQNNKKDDK